jgi:hypothetical protein
LEARRIVIAEKRVHFAPFDKHAADPKEAGQLDLEAHALLEACLVDSVPASDPVGAAHPAPTIAPPERAPSIWQSIKRLFG